MALKFAFAALHPLGIFFFFLRGEAIINGHSRAFCYAACFLLPGPSAPWRSPCPARRPAVTLPPPPSGIPVLSGPKALPAQALRPACGSLGARIIADPFLLPFSLAVPEHTSLCGAGMTFPILWAVIPPLPPIEVLQDSWARPLRGSYNNINMILPR